MKKQLFSFMIVTLAIIFTSISASAIDYPSAGSAIVDKPAINKSTEDLEIFIALDGKFYIFCKSCPIIASNGFLQEKIIDTLNFIDPDIPQKEWLNAYTSGSYTYRWNPKRSTIKFDHLEFRIDNCWDNTRAILVGDSLKSFTLKNVIRNDKMSSVQFGKFMIFGLLIIGLLAGLWIKNLKKRIQIITFIVALALIAFFICIMFNGTLLALSIPIGSFILGNLIAFAIFGVLHFLRRRAQEKKTK